MSRNKQCRFSLNSSCLPLTWTKVGIAVAFSLLAGAPFSAARADESGVSFWLPGQYGSLAAVPQMPGFSFASIYYHTSVKAGGNVAFARQVHIGRRTPTLFVDINARLRATGDLALGNVNYVFAEPFLGGQFAIGMTGVYARSSATLDASAFATLGPFSVFRAASITDTVTGFGDLYPTASLRWNAGVHNFMTYVTGDIPVGTYNADRLANIGINHGAVDGGVGYTYFNPETGHEFSAVAGLTYNWKNPETDYRNGVDGHLDWGASQFLSKQVHVGLVGYWYNQISGDSGSGNRVGPFESRVVGIGPQAGFILPMGDMQAYLNVKGYREFDADNRARGWNAWVTLQIAPAQQVPPTAPRRPIVSKY